MNKKKAIELLQNMNKKEAIELLQEMSKESFKLAKIHAVYIDSIVEVVNEIDEPQKVVIPKFVAEWLEECKRSGWHLQKVIYRLDDDEKVGDWAYDENDDLIPEKVDMIARAWLDGFDVEKEKLYTVDIPNPHSYIDNHTRLARNYKGKVVLEVQDWLNTLESYKLTEAEIKEDFEWAWQFAKEAQ